MACFQISLLAALFSVGDCRHRLASATSGVPSIVRPPSDFLSEGLLNLATSTLRLYSNPPILQEIRQAIHMAPDACRTALSNYDILWHILSSHYISGRTQADVTRRDYLNEKDMAQCARVSHAFSTPASRLLWSKLRSLWPLWYLLAPATLSHQDNLSVVSPLRCLHRRMIVMHDLSSIMYDTDI